MSEVKSVRKVKESTWRELKAIASRSGIPIPALLDSMVNGYSNSSSRLWDRILVHEKLLSDSEAKILREELKVFRKERGFRI